MTNDNYPPAADGWASAGAPPPPGQPVGPPMGDSPAPWAQPAAPAGSFDAPAGYGPAGYAPTAAPKNKRKWIWIAVAIIFVLGAVSRVVEASNSKKPLTAPTTLAGRSQTTNATLSRQATDIADKIKKDNKGRSSAAAFYEKDGIPDVALVAIRARTSESRDVKDAIKGGFPIDASTKRKINGVSCYNTNDKKMSFCLWHDKVSGFVVALEDPNLDAAAAIAKEARAALK